MRAEQLKDVLDEVKSIFSAAGVTAVEKDIALLADYVASHGSRELDDVFAEMRDRLDPAGKKKLASLRHIQALRDAGMDEARFSEALTAIKSDRTLDKGDIAQLAKDYGVIRINAKSRDACIESIDKYFYWSLYNRDADEMAKRATPW